MRDVCLGSAVSEGRPFSALVETDDPKLDRHSRFHVHATDAELEAERVGGALPSRLLWRS